MPRLNDARVNDRDYEGRIVIEKFNYWNDSEPSWAVPDWEERGEGDLAGPFATRAEAIAALRRQEEMWDD